MGGEHGAQRAHQVFGLEVEHLGLHGELDHGGVERVLDIRDDANLGAQHVARAASRSRLTSSGPSTTGSLRGSRTVVMPSFASPRPRVTAEEEAQGRDGCIHGGRRGPVRSHVQPIAPQVLRIRPIRRAAEKGREIPDRVDVSSLDARP